MLEEVAENRKGREGKTAFHRPFSPWIIYISDNSD